MRKLLIVWIVIISLIFTESTSFSQYLQPYGNIAWNADGDLLSLTRFNGEVDIIDTQTKALVTIIETDEANPIARWHPLRDDILAVTAAENRIQIWNVRTTEMLLEGFEPDIRVLFDFQWSPNGDLIATSYVSAGTNPMNTGIHLWDANTARLVTRDLVSGNGWFHFRWKPDGQQIAYSVYYNDPSVVGIVDTSTGENVASFVGVESELDGIPTRTCVDVIGWNYDGSLFVTQGPSNPFEVWDGTTYEAVENFLIFTTHPRTFSWHPSHNIFAILDLSGTQIQIYSEETNEILHTISSESDYHFSSFAWSPDGTQIAYIQSNDRESTLVIDDVTTSISS